MLGDRRRCDVGSGGEFDGEEVGRGGGDAECAEGLCDLSLESAIGLELDRCQPSIS